MYWMDSINAAYLAFDTALEGRGISDSHSRGNVKPFGPRRHQVGGWHAFWDGWIPASTSIIVIVQDRYILGNKTLQSLQVGVLSKWGSPESAAVIGTPYMQWDDICSTPKMQVRISYDLVWQVWVAQRHKGRWDAEILLQSVNTNTQRHTAPPHPLSRSASQLVQRMEARHWPNFFQLASEYYAPPVIWGHVPTCTKRAGWYLLVSGFRLMQAGRLRIVASTS